MSVGKIVVLQSPSCVQLFVTPWTAACQSSQSLTISQSLPKFMSIESVMPYNHLTLCCPFLLCSIFPSIRVFPCESAIHIRWRKCWSVSFSISPSKVYSGLISFKTIHTLSEFTGFKRNPWECEGPMNFQRSNSGINLIYYLVYMCILFRSSVLIPRIYPKEDMLYESL